MPERLCYARDCREVVDSSKLMCPRHWRAVPAALQQRVYAALRARDAGDAGGMRAYVEAIQAARDAVTPRTPVFYTVPAGTRPSTCRGPRCGAPMFWVRDAGRAVPVDCAVPGGRAPSESKHRDQADLFAPGGLADVHDGRGVSHFTTCPDVGMFARSGGAVRHA